MVQVTVQGNCPQEILRDFTILLCAICNSGPLSQHAEQSLQGVGGHLALEIKSFTPEGTHIILLAAHWLDPPTAKKLGNIIFHMPGKRGEPDMCEL